MLKSLFVIHIIYPYLCYMTKIKHTFNYYPFNHFFIKCEYCLKSVYVTLRVSNVEERERVVKSTLSEHRKDICKTLHRDKLINEILDE